MTGLLIRSPVGEQVSTKNLARARNVETGWSGGQRPGANPVGSPPMASPPEIERWSGFKVWLFSLRNRTPQSNLAAVDRIAPGPGDRFLDLGCGLGAAVERAAVTGAEVAGVDPSAAMVDKARERVPSATFAVGSAEDIPFPDGAFTVVIAVATYHHWADPAAGLAEVHRILDRDGRLLLVERKLRRRKGHGLHPTAARDVATQLQALGFATAAVDHLRVGRKLYLAIAATKPT
jgi:SAM-dependent methyltransferase